MSDDQPETLTDVVDALKERSDGEEEMSISEALDAFSGRLFGPLLIVPGLIVASPLGAIPTLPTIMAVVIFLVAVQLLFGSKHPWLPSFIAERSVAHDRFVKAMDKFRPWAKWIDRFTAPRMQYLVTGPMQYALAFVCILLAAAMPPLELVPFAALAPGSAVLLIGLAMTSRDGLFGLLGTVASLITLWVLVQWVIL